MCDCLFNINVVEAWFENQSIDHFWQNDDEFIPFSKASNHFKSNE